MRPEPQDYGQKTDRFANRTAKTDLQCVPIRTAGLASEGEKNVKASQQEESYPRFYSQRAKSSGNFPHQSQEKV